MNLRPFSAAILIALAACSQAPDKTAAPLAGARIGGPFTLIDQNGRPRSQRDFAGKWRIMYFGYTFCPDVCPLDMQNVGAGLKLLASRDAAKAAKIVPTFVTVDPERDTPAVLKQFVSAFHPRMVGLTGTPKAIDAVAKEYAIYHAKGESTTGGYLVNHSRQAYLTDPAGKPVMLVPADQSPEAVADALEKWVS